jgi:hypothetical protein
MSFDCVLKGRDNKAQGKTGGRSPGAALPHFYGPERVAQKTIDTFCAAPTGRKRFFGGNQVPRVADFVLTLGYDVLPPWGNSAAIINAIIVSNGMAFIYGV